MKKRGKNPIQTSFDSSLKNLDDMLYGRARATVKLEQVLDEPLFGEMLEDLLEAATDYGQAIYNPRSGCTEEDACATRLNEAYEKVLKASSAIFAMAKE